MTPYSYDKIYYCSTYHFLYSITAMKCPFPLRPNFPLRLAKTSIAIFFKVV